MVLQVLKQRILGETQQKYGPLPVKADDILPQKPIDRRHRIYLKYQSEDPLKTLSESLNQKKMSRKLHRGFEEEIQTFLHTLKSEMQNKSRVELFRLFLVLFLLIFGSLSIVFIEAKQSISATMMAICIVSYLVWGFRFAVLLRTWKRLDKCQFEDFTDQYANDKGRRSPFMFMIYKDGEAQYMEVRMVGRSKMKRTTKKASLFVITEEEFEDEIEEMHQRDVENKQGCSDSD